MGLGLVWKSLEDSVNFINRNLLRIIPFSLLFFFAALTYSACWHILDVYKDMACLNGNYIIELLFCSLYLGTLGKGMIAVAISSFSIIPFAGLIYLTHKIANNSNGGIVESIKGNFAKIMKVIAFRAALTIIVFLPFIIYVVFGEGIIEQYVTGTGRLTVEKLLTMGLMPIPITLLLGFALTALLEPVFQYVEYEVLIFGARVRDAIRNSATIALKFKTESFVFGFIFVAIWHILILTKLMYTLSPVLIVALLAAIFIESFFLFPLRAIALYFMWSKLRSGYELDKKDVETKAIKSYMDKMMLG